VKVEGTITYIHERTCFLQDDSGAVRLAVQPDSAIHVNDRVEVVGFPVSADPIRVLAEPRFRVLGSGTPLEPRALNLSDAVRYNGSLVRVRASLLVQKNLGRLEVLELQAGQRICDAVLAGHGTQLPPLPEGSQVEITGVCVARAAPEPNTGPANWETLSRASLQLLLRAPTDVTVRRTPPWWAPKKVMASIGGVVTVLGGTLVWMRLLRRRYELRQRSQLEFSRQILESQETERRRIAVNLHDSLGQNLLVIKNQACLAMQPGLERPAVLQRLNEISGMASQVIEEVRQITHDLRPAQLDRVGLSQTLRGTIRSVSESGPIAFASHVDEIDGLFESDGEIHIYRILQEGLNNVVKHSGATEATAVVKKEGNCLLMIVRDNGHGFASGTRHGMELPQAGLGLSGISERARILHGKVAFDSDPGQGFRLTVEIPLPGNHDTP
jgi:signal transduction histidine kinase